MVYLDYSATTPVNDEVLKTFEKVTKEFFGNPNSLYDLGVKSSKLVEESSEIISNFFHVKKDEIIYTSGSTESNNLAIFGVINQYPKRPKRIITTHLEHSSIKEPLKYLENKGYEILYVNLKADGTVDVDNLKELLQKDVCLVSICAVDSEMGIRQPVEEIGKILKDYQTVIFHSDITQAVGKVAIDLKDVDLASFSGHKIYGIKGIGGLIKKSNIIISPIILGGKSTTVYRAGTPPVALIASLAKAIKVIPLNKNKIDYYNVLIRNKLKNYSNIIINSTDESIPQILNFSILGIRPETVIHMLEQEKIYVSSKTACSSKENISQSVYSLYNDYVRASSTIRISISSLTTLEEINTFLDVFDRIYSKLLFKN